MKKFNQKQKEDIISIGFGGLLALNVHVLPLDIIKWFVDNFNPVSRILSIPGGQKVVIKEDHFYNVFELPRVGSEVDVFELSESEDSKEIYNRIKGLYNIDMYSSVPMLKDLLVDGFEEGGVDFKRLFVLYCMSSFLAPKGNYTVDTSVLKSLVDVDRIKGYDWNSFCFETLCQSIQKYKEFGLKNICGCLLALQIIYFHHLIWKGKLEPSALPLIKHWDTKSARKRILEERKAGVFGQGEWVINLNVQSEKVSVEEKKMEKGKEKVVDEGFDPVMKVVDEINSGEEGIGDNVRFIRFRIPPGEQTDEDIKKISKDVSNFLF